MRLVLLEGARLDFALCALNAANTKKGQARRPAPTKAKKRTNTRLALQNNNYWKAFIFSEFYRVKFFIDDSVPTKAPWALPEPVKDKIVIAAV